MVGVGHRPSPGPRPKTIRAYLRGDRQVGKRKTSRPDDFAAYVSYLAARFREDPHVWATALFDEVVALGFAKSYQSFTRELRARKLRPHCEACSGVKGRDTIEIEHPPGEEVQWDWLELGAAPWGGEAHLLLGSLPYSGKFRGVFSEHEDQAHLIEGIDGVLRRLGGTARRWRVDRLATVVDPGSGVIQRSFLPVAKHYGVSVVPCPPRRANRKGSVEKSAHYAAQRWWRTARATTRAEAQASFDRFCSRIADRRTRPPAKLAGAGLPDAARGDIHRDGGTPDRADRRPIRPTVAELAELEALLPLPVAPYPATVEVVRTIDRSALVAFDGNAYSVPPGLSGTEVLIRHRLGSATLEVITSTGRSLAFHRRVPGGMGQVVRLPQHRVALEAAVLLAFTTAPPCRRKENRPPGAEARVEAARLLGALSGDVVVDLARYEELVSAR